MTAPPHAPITPKKPPRIRKRQPKAKGAPLHSHKRAKHTLGGQSK